MTIFSYVLLIAFVMLVLFIIIMLGTYQYSIAGNFRESLTLFAKFSRSPFFKIEINTSGRQKVKMVFTVIGISFKPDWLNGDRSRKKEKPKKKRPEQTPSKLELTKLVLDKHIRNHILALFKAILLVIRPRVFSLKGTYGFDDPHLTGWCFAFICFIQQIIKTANIDVEPDWEEAVCDLNASIQGSFTGASLAWCLIRFVISRNTLVLFKRVRKLSNNPGYAT